MSFDHLAQEKVSNNVIIAEEMPILWQKNRLKIVLQ
jgi:hypothetical protein